MNGRLFYFEEVEINDYPQKARYALNNRAEMDRIQDWTGASIGIRGNYVPPGKKPALGSRRLHLYIEADSPAKVTRAKTECINFLENATKGQTYDTDMIKAYTTYWCLCNKRRLQKVADLGGLPHSARKTLLEPKDDSPDSFPHLRFLVRVEEGALLHRRHLLLDFLLVHFQIHLALLLRALRLRLGSMLLSLDRGGRRGFLRNHVFL